MPSPGAMGTKAINDAEVGNSRTMSQFSIDGRAIGAGEPPFLIAELSGNHNGDMARALRLVDKAAESGADAIKLQTYTADTITIDHAGPGFTISGGLWDGRTLHDLYQEAHTPWDWHPELFARARAGGLIVFSSPFDETAIDFLEEQNCPAYKIASFEAMDLPLVAKAAATGKPMIASTGMVDEDEIAELITTARQSGGAGLALLHCVSAYPAPVTASNLRAIPVLAERHGTVVGLSDHTPGSAVAVAAVSLGAAIIEKHFCLSRADGGVDAAFSLEPDEFRRLADDCRTAWQALGEVRLGRQAAAEPNLQFRRSLYAVRDIAAGEIMTGENVRSIRPGYGLAPKHLDQVVGRRAAGEIPRGTPLSWDLFAGDEAREEE